MKHLVKIISIISILSLWYYNVTFSGPLGVDDISVTSENSIEVTFSENPTLKVGEIDAEIKILRDISLRGSFMAEQNTVEILLEDPIAPNTSYSLLTIVGGEGSIDFVTPETIEGSIINNVNSVEVEDIASIEIIDSRNILVSYRQELLETNFEYKLLAESTIEKIENKDYLDSKITISVTPPFASEKDYILMFIDIRDVDWNYLEFDTGIYDFTTTLIEEWSFPEDTEEDTLEDELELPEVVQIDTSTGDETDTNNEALPSDSWDESEENILNSAWSDVSTEQSINAVAGTIMETPDTGAETWVLIIASLLINSIYYLSRRKKLILA